MKKERLYKIYWGGRVSCFYLKSWKQAILIAKQYKGVARVEEVLPNGRITKWMIKEWCG